MKGRELTPQLSQSSVLSLADSHTEFFDACEVLLSASSSENEVREEEDGSRSGGTWGRWVWGPEIPVSFLATLAAISERLPIARLLETSSPSLSRLTLLWSLKSSSHDPTSAFTLL